jgi:hypothetical protein
MNFGVKRHFQQYFSYIMATSFIGGRSRSTRKKPATLGKREWKVSAHTQQRLPKMSLSWQKIVFNFFH